MEKENEGINKNTLDNSVLKHIILCSCGLILAGAFASFFLRKYLPAGFTQGFLVGSIGGLANLYFLILLIVSTFNPVGVQPVKLVAGLTGLNASLVVIIYPAWMRMVDLTGLTVGFTLILAVMLTAAYAVIRRKENS